MIFILATIFTIAMFWMIVIAIQNDQLIWGIGMFFLVFPLSFIYGIIHWNQAKKPLLLMIGTIALIGIIGT